MSLPTVVAPRHSVKLFSLPKPIEFRPYLVKEEKLLLMAQQGDDKAEVERAIRDIVHNCTFGKVNAVQLATFDLALLFLQLRAKSVNNVINTRFRCVNKVGGQGSVGLETECGTVIDVSINIDDIKLTVPDGHTNKVWLDDELGVTLKYPSYELELAGVTDVASVLPKCLDTVFTKNGDVYEVKDEEPAKVQEFVESLSLQHIERMRVFFDTMPHVEYKFTFKCPKCGYSEEVTLKDLMDFFD